MSEPRRLRPPAGTDRLRRIRRRDRVELWTEAVGPWPPVYGERWRELDTRLYRSFEPGRSKLAAALARAWEGPLPRAGERWLYLGAASGTTASHVADLVGPTGRVYAVEKSVRPFARLYRLSDRWRNLLPVLADARTPDDYEDLVPPVDGVYADVAQPDQVRIVHDNAALFLRGAGTAVLLALKTASMGRDRTAASHLAGAEEELDRFVELAPSVRLDPFHRAHYFVGGTARPSLFPDERRRPPVTSPPGPHRGPPRR